MITFERKTNTIISSMDLKSFKYKIAYWIMYSIMLVIAIICIVPSIWAFVSGFKEPHEIYAIPNNFFPETFSFDNVVVAWKALDFLPNIFATFIVGIGDVFFVILTAGFGGYVLSKIKPRGWRFIFTLIVWTMMMPGQMRMVPMYKSFIEFPIGGMNLLNTYWPLWLIAMAQPYKVLLFKTNFDAIPSEYIEAAKIDGCSEIGIFLKIMVPLSVPVVTYVTVTSLNSVWSDFFWPMLTLSEQSLQTVPVRIFALQSSTNITISQYMMALTFASLPPIILFALFQKQLMQGVAVGGVKG